MLTGLIYFILIVMAAIGFAVVMNALCRQFLYPVGRRRYAATVLPFSSSCSDIETSVSFFAKYSDSGPFHYVIILDEGLDENGVECAKLLTQKYPNVLLCNADNLYSSICEINGDQTYTSE